MSKGFDIANVSKYDTVINQYWREEISATYFSTTEALLQNSGVFNVQVGSDIHLEMYAPLYNNGAYRANYIRIEYSHDGAAWTDLGTTALFGTQYNSLSNMYGNSMVSGLIENYQYNVIQFNFYGSTNTGGCTINANNISTGNISTAGYLFHYIVTEIGNRT